LLLFGLNGLGRYTAPKLFVRNFAIAFAANVNENVAIFHLEEVTLSVNGVDCDIEDLVKSFVISALARISHG
jgi:hypothetical protein